MSKPASPLVSILIPAFNSARFLSKAIESAIGQTYEHIEVVIVDNASNDTTLELAQQYADRFPNISVYRNGTNLGPVANWRRCAELAKGEYACLLFSDDWYEPEFVEKTLCCMLNEDVGFAYASVYARTEADGSIKKISYRRESGGVFPSRDFLSDHLYANEEGVPLSPGCALFRTRDMRDALNYPLIDQFDIGFSAHGAGPDMLLYLLQCVRYASFAYVDLSLANFLSHENNLSKERKVNLAYALAKASFVARHAGQLQEGDVRKFCATHALRLAGLNALRLYSRSLADAGLTWKIDWGFLVRSLINKLRKRLWVIQ